MCADWPLADPDRYLGPFDKQTTSPVLVVGNLHDPATRYQGALTAHALLPNSRLLTVEGWGHTSLFLSACATAIQSTYLLTGNAPTSSTCSQDVTPFQ